MFERTVDAPSAVAGEGEVVLWARLTRRGSTDGQRTGRLAVDLEACPPGGGACALLAEGSVKADQDRGETDHTARAVPLAGVGGVVPSGGTLRLTVAVEQGNADAAELAYGSAERPARLVVTVSEQPGRRRAVPRS